ncbi:Tat pathway signal protein, partial [Streptomyces aidingensis]
MARARNSRMESLLRELGWSQEQLAARFRRVAAENGADELRAVTRSHVNQWLRGSRPGGRAPHILCETFSRGLGRVVTAPEIGLDMGGEDLPQDTDPVMALAELGSMELDRQRRQMLTGAAYSLAGLALATGEGPAAQARPSRRPVCGGHTTAADVAGAREMMAFFSRRDQRRGGGDGRAALVAYLRTDIVAHLGRRFPGEQVRREMFSTASELVYLCGWMSFDAGEHGLAQRYFTLSLHLAAEADDAPLAGHILRAMAHQAVDLGHPQHALALADASLEQRRYTRATPRERALLGVVHARSLA